MTKYDGGDSITKQCPFKKHTTECMGDKCGLYDVTEGKCYLANPRGLVQSILAGQNVTITPPEGIGNVTINAVGGGTVIPSGVICMWHGLLSDIPTGWALCNGSNGTPDLRDKFVKGAPAGADPGGIGGLVSHTHADHPALSHSGTAVGDHASKNTAAADVGASKLGTTTSTLTLKAHLHSISAYIHSVTQPNEHSAQSHNTVNHEPPYFRVAYIMKL